MTEEERAEDAATHLTEEQREALRRLEDGTCGRCTECGGAISVDRLLVFPETPTCVSCAG